jgi:tetratricopeptide (TPR) repeat protein
MEFLYPDANLAQKSKSIPARHRSEAQPKSGILPCIILFFLVVVVFLPSLRNGFFSLDDGLYVTANPHVTPGLTLQGISWAWRTSEASNWHPLTWISHMIDCQLFGLNPEGHHATSLLLHALNTVLLFLFLKQATGAFWKSFIVAALFGVHPLRVESVAWVAERKDVLSALFWLLTLLAYLRYTRAGNSQKDNLKFYFLALFLFALGLMSKPMLVTLPFALLLLDFWPLKRWSKSSAGKLLVEKVPFLLLALVSSIVTYTVQRKGGAVIPTESLPFQARFGNAVVSYARYLGKTICPINLSPIYPHPGYWPPEAVAGAALLLLGITAVVLWQRRAMPYLSMGWFWFLGTLVPVIGLVQVGLQAMADRYTYIPSIGLLVGLVWAFAKLTEPLKNRDVLRCFAAAAAVFACIVITARQIAYWKDSITLYEHAIRVTDKNWFAMDSLGNEFRHNGNENDAIAEYQEALQINAYRNDVRDNLGALLIRQRRFTEALEQFQIAASQDPTGVSAQQGIGTALQDMGRLDEAIAQFKKVIRLKPDYADAYSNLGNCLGMKGDGDGALKCFQEAVKLDPKSAENHRDLAVGLLNHGRITEGIDELRQALQIDPSDIQAQQNLRSALQSQANSGKTSR